MPAIGRSDADGQAAVNLPSEPVTVIGTGSTFQKMEFEAIPGEEYGIDLEAKPATD